MSENRRDYILFLEDIIDAIEKIERYTKDLSFDEFSKREIVQDAVIRNFEIIGEAARNVPIEIQTKYSAVEWKEAKGFRDILIHDYFGVDIEAVWDTIKNDIPLLKGHIMEVLTKEK